MGEPSLHVLEDRSKEKVENSDAVRINLYHVQKSFGEKVVLQDISLEIEAGQFVVIVGKSGSGKSTLLRLASGLEKPTSGDITFNDIPIKNSPAKATMMYQDSRLLPWKSVLNNVGLGLRGNWQAEAEKTLEHVGLLPFKDEWPSKLSGGQQQRVALARALMHNPSLLLLDEPLNNLDMRHSVQIMKTLRKLVDELGKTVVIVIHDINFASCYSDEIVALKDGKVVKQGRTCDVIDSCVLKDIYDMDIDIKEIDNQRICVYF